MLNGCNASGGAGNTPIDQNNKVSPLHGPLAHASGKHGLTDSFVSAKDHAKVSCKALKRSQHLVNLLLLDAIYFLPHGDIAPP